MQRTYDNAYNWDIVENGVKHHTLPHTYESDMNYRNFYNKHNDNYMLIS
jgi:hypothetical protein